MNEKLQALFAQNKTAVLGVAGAGVVGLALLQRKKKGATAGAPSASPAGTIPAAGVVPASGVQGTFPDTTESNVYNSVMDALLKQQAAMTSAGGGTPLAAPTPIASTLFAPTRSGNYVAYPNGTIAEVESDGSLLGLIDDQWKQLASDGASYTRLKTNLNPTVGGVSYFETGSNLEAQANKFNTMTAGTAG